MIIELKSPILTVPTPRPSAKVTNFRIAPFGVANHSPIISARVCEMLELDAPGGFL